MRHVFLDESSQNAHRYMVLGAVIAPGQFVRPVEAALEKLLAHHGVTTSELKWTKVSRGKAAAYQAIVDYYFRKLAPNGFEAHALVVDSSMVNHAAYNDGDSELGFNKFIHLLLRHRVGKKFGDLERLVVDLDSRTSSRELSELQLVLNRAAAKDLEKPGHYPYGRVAHRDSKTSRLMQLADLFSGAIAWHKNEHDKNDGASPAKTALANHLAEKLDLHRLGETSRYSESRLSVWNLRLQPQRGRARQSRP